MSLGRLQRFLALGELPLSLGEADALACVELARAHGVAAQLDEALENAGVAWPEAGRRALRQAHRAALVRGTQLQERALRALVLLRAASLRALPMKGLALLLDVYASPAERPMADADVLMLEGWDAALALLEREGYRVRERADHAWALQDPASGMLELHRGLSTCPELHPVDPGVWQRRVSAGEYERPGNEDLLVQLAVHAAFQHALRLRLGQYLDFRRLLERPLDVPLTLAVAERHHAVACLFASLSAAEALVGAPFPEPLRTALLARQSGRVRRRVAALVREPLVLVAPASARAVAGWRLLLAGPRGLELVVRTLLPREGTPFSQALRGVRLLRQLV